MPQLTILSVEDNPVNQRLLVAQLEPEGHTVLKARDGLEGLNVLGKQKVDLIISDVLMPNMDGFTLCTRVRENEKYKHIPFIIYSSTHVTEKDKKLGIECGADIFLEKTGDCTQLLENIYSVRSNVTSRLPRWKPLPEEIKVLKTYSELLVRKLEEKNEELQERVRALERFRAEAIDDKNLILLLKKEINALHRELNRPEPYPDVNPR